MRRLTFEELSGIHRELCSDGLATMAKKNHDYGGGNGDLFANFRSAEGLGMHPIVGVLLRINDKLMRVKTFCDKGQLLVKDEGVEDAIKDSINYLVLIAGMIREEKLNRVQPTTKEGTKPDAKTDTTKFIPPGPIVRFARAGDSIPDTATIVSLDPFSGKIGYIGDSVVASGVCDVQADVCSQTF